MHIVDNWEIKEFLRRVQSQFYNGNDTVHFFRRTTEREDYYIDRTSVQIIDEAIKYIEELEYKVSELSYAQRIIDEVRRQDGRT